MYTDKEFQSVILARDTYPEELMNLSRVLQQHETVPHILCLGWEYHRESLQMQVFTWPNMPFAIPSPKI